MRITNSKVQQEKIMLNNITAGVSVAVAVGVSVGLLG